MELFYFLLPPLLFLLAFLYLPFVFPPKKTPNDEGLIYALLGDLPAFAKNRHRFLDWVAEVLAELPAATAAFRLPGGVRGVLTADPGNVEYMLKTNFGNFPKGERSCAVLEDFLGRGIFNVDGDLWKAQRRTANIEFNTKSFRNLVTETVRREIDQRLLPLLHLAADAGDTLDLQDTLERFTFDNICKVAFNVDPKCLAPGAAAATSELADAFDDASNLISDRFLEFHPIVWKTKKLLNLGSERRLRDSVSIIHTFAAKIIRSRREGAVGGDDDLLSRFMAGTGAGAGAKEEDLLRDIVISFILAGRDTSSAALTWFFWLLSSRPEVEKTILKEIDAVGAVGADGAVSFERLRELPYLHAAISEAMRLYPPVPVDWKECMQDDTLPNGTTVRKGWRVAYCAYAMGRTESVWGADCRSYKPERWVEEGVFRAEAQFKYPVFHGGARICLGKEMAYIQMKAIAACVLKGFQVEVVRRGGCPEPTNSLTLRMKEGLPVRVMRRK